jgi:hypothetical protein
MQGLQQESHMASNDPIDRTVVSRTDTSPSPAAVDGPVTPPVFTQQTTTQTTTTGPNGVEMGRRVAVLLFGLIQTVISLRIVLLVLDAREGNGLVSGILNVSQIFVAPFDGIFHTNALHAGGSILDFSAIAALVGWTVLELIAVWALGVFRRGPA